MAMRATTVRFTEDLWSLLERESGAQGVSAAQFIRDATILRVAVLAERRGDREAQLTVEEVAAGALRPAGRERPDALPGVRDRGRLEAVRATGLLDAPPDPALDRLASLAGKVLNAPVAMVSIVDEERQFFASCLGVTEPLATTRETPLSYSFCQHTVSTREPLVVSDAREHPTLRDNLAVGALGVVAYAGVPLITREGHALGSLCVIDRRPRAWTRDQIALLVDLGASVVSEIELAVVRRAAAA
jgi:GAF domain-containing protein